MTCILPRTLGILSILLTAGSAHAQAWGTLTGRFVVNGAVPPQGRIQQNVGPGIQVVDESVVVARNGDLHGACIYLRTKNVAVAPKYAASANDEVTLEISNLRFNPHFVLLRTSQTLKLLNSEAVGHAPKLDSITNPSWHPLLAAGATVKHKLSNEDSLPIKVSDNTQPWMLAWLLVRDSPYAAASSGDGKFAIKDLPAGAELEFQLWHEYPGYLKKVAYEGGSTDNKGRFKITIKPGDNDLGDIIVPAAMLTKR